MNVCEELCKFHEEILLSGFKPSLLDVGNSVNDCTTVQLIDDLISWDF